MHGKIIHCETKTKREKVSKGARNWGDDDSGVVKMMVIFLQVVCNLGVVLCGIS